MTNLEVYKDVLNKLRQYATATLYPTEFDSLWNIEMMNYVALRASEDEKDEKRNQDLQVLKVVDEIPNTGANSAGNEVFVLPYDPINKVDTAGNPGFKNFGFYRIENVDVKGSYTLCGVTKQLEYETMWPWIKDDTKHVIGNPFRQPAVDAVQADIYYEQRGFKLYVHASSNFIASMIRLEYLRYPQYMDVTNNPATQVELPVYVINEIGSRLRSEFLMRNGNPLYQASLAQQKTTVN
jgi:hypothetical protein